MRFFLSALILVTLTGCAPMPVGAPVATLASQAPASFNGSGRVGLQGPFTLQAGVRTFKATHAGTGNFIVWLADASGKDTQLLFNETAPFTAAKTFKASVLASGAYHLNVSAASGAWTLEVE